MSVRREHLSFTRTSGSELSDQGFTEFSFHFRVSWVNDVDKGIKSPFLSYYWSLNLSILLLSVGLLWFLLCDLKSYCGFWKVDPSCLEDSRRSPGKMGTHESSVICVSTLSLIRNLGIGLTYLWQQTNVYLWPFLTTYSYILKSCSYLVIVHHTLPLFHYQIYLCSKKQEGEMVESESTFFMYSRMMYTKYTDQVTI